MRLSVITTITAGLIILNTGCVNMQQMQSGMNEIDSFWGETNQNILSSKGTRVYLAEQSDCWNAARKAVTQLGFTITHENASSKLTATALTPAPFDTKEYKDIKAIEEPMMQAIAANHVGKFYSNFYVLDSDGNFYITINVNIIPDGSNKTFVQIAFRLDPKEEVKDFTYGHNPPPESVRKGLHKWWNAFENKLNTRRS